MLFVWANVIRVFGMVWVLIHGVLERNRKNRRRAREPREPQSARRRSCWPERPLRHPATETPATQPPRTAAKPRVIAGVPVDAVGREVEGIVAGTDFSLVTRTSRRRLVAGGTTIDVKTTATHEGDRLA